MERINILNVPIDNCSMKELIEKLKVGGVVFTPNVDHLVKLQKDKEFYHVYQQADYRVCDSQLLFLASRFLGKPLVEKISGSDLFPAFCQYCSEDKNIKIFLLGGLNNVAEKARQNINIKTRREIVVGSYSPPFGFESDEAECQKIIAAIERSGANVLAVGLGAPKQEKWIYQHKSQLKNIKTFFAIGATLDFEAGNLKRAPKWISLAGLEWFYRLLLEPKRLWRRYLLEDTTFFLLILRQKIKSYYQPIVSKKSGLFKTERNNSTGLRSQ